MALGIVRRLSAAAVERLRPVLAQAGTSLLLRIVDNRAPAASDVVRRVAEGLGLPVTTAPSTQAAAITDAYEANPEQVTRIVQQVERVGRNEWQGIADAMDAVNITMRQEARSANWLVRSWRPIFALVTVVTTPVYIGLFYHLLLAGKPDAASFGNVLMVVIPALVSVTGVYVWGRTREKEAGAA